MGKIAFIFAGQGAQAPGMGQSFYEHSAAAKAIFDEADAIRPGTKKQCFSGSPEELKDTATTQPCLFCVEAAIAACLSEENIKADVTAGFSLGEMSAHLYAGSYSFADGLALVIKRGKLMQEAALSQDTQMAAVLKLPTETVEEVCADYPNIYPVNYNCPGQISVSGKSADMPAFFDAIKSRGGRTLPIKVSGAFHSPYMDKAASAFSDIIQDAHLSTPNIPIYANFTGQLYSEDVKSDLSVQMNHPVLWEATLRNMIKDGVDTFVEVGPGKTLTGFVKKTDPSVRAFTLNEYDNLAAIKTEINKC